jgi:hypothetical protein
MTREPLQLPNISYASDNGVIKTPDINVPIKDVSAHLSKEGEIIIEGTIEAHHPIIRNFEIVFQDNAGWKIFGENFSIFNEGVSVQAGKISLPLFATFKAKGHKLIIKRGEISSTDRVNIYKILTDINFAGEVRVAGFSEYAVKFSTDQLKDLILIKSNVPQVPRSAGYFEITDTYENYSDKWFDIIDNLLLLFRFAASNMINFPVIYIKNSQGDELIEITSYITEGGRGSSIFYLSYPGTLSKLVDSTYNNLASSRLTLDLDKLILYYIMMKNTSFVDNEYLLGCVFMEGLKYSFAKNIKNYTLNGEKFIKTNGKPYYFKELIDEVYQYFNVKCGDTDFIRYRNEVIHQGAISSIPFEEILLKKGVGGSY